MATPRKLPLTLARAITILILAASTTPAPAQTPGPLDLSNSPTSGGSGGDLSAAPSPSTLTIRTYVENDSYFLKPNDPHDGHYTHGTALTISHQPDWARRLAQNLDLADPTDRVAVGYVAAQLMFTPDNITRSTPIPDDRPYAGHLYFGIYGQRANQPGTILDHIQLNLGVVGPSSLADDIQQAVHKAFEADEPSGWEHQLPNEPTIQIHYRRKWKALRDDLTLFNQPLQWELIPQAGFALGTVHRNVEGSVLLRIGANLPDDFGPGRIGDLAAATARLDDPRPTWSAYLFGRLGGSIVEHNLYLDGNAFRDSPSVDSKPLVGEAQLGLSLQHRRENFTLEISYAQTFLTHQFEQQDRTDSFATLTAALLLGF